MKTFSFLGKLFSNFGKILFYMEAIFCVLWEGGGGLLETPTRCPGEFSVCNSLPEMSRDRDLAQQGHAPCFEWKSTESEISDWEMDL